MTAGGVYGNAHVVVADTIGCERIVLGRTEFNAVVTVATDVVALDSVVITGVLE